MADRVYHPCPYCGDLIFYYDESDISRCDLCGKSFKCMHELVEVVSSKTITKYPEKCLIDGKECYYLYKKCREDIKGNKFVTWECCCEEELGASCIPTQCPEVKDEEL